MARPVERPNIIDCHTMRALCHRRHAFSNLGTRTNPAMSPGNSPSKNHIENRAFFVNHMLGECAQNG